jgi:hypothetical protein
MTYQFVDEDVGKDRHHTGVCQARVVVFFHVLSATERFDKLTSLGDR